MERIARRTRRLVPAWGLALVTLGLGGCSQHVMTRSAVASVAPQLTVERFLQASNDRDFEGMSRIFGTADGPVGNTGSPFGCFFKKIGSWFGGDSCVRRQDVEIQMALIADILTHTDYQFVGERQVPGRDQPTMQLLVDLMVERGTARAVPFVVVRAGDGQWFLEQVDLELVMAVG